MCNEMSIEQTDATYLFDKSSNSPDLICLLMCECSTSTYNVCACVHA